MPGAIVHEWIEPSGGAEKVLDAFAAEFPEAPIYALWSDDPDRYAPGRVTESWIARTPLRRHKAAALPLLLATWRHLWGADEMDWLLISSHLFAHHARPDRVNIPKLVYAHTPARYIWAPELDARGAGAVARAASTLIRPIDRKRADEARAVAANSSFVRLRIAKAWRRDATVIYPPVGVERITSIDDWRTQLNHDELIIIEGIGDGFVLGASRFVPYKRLDIAIDTGEFLGLPVVIAGRGPDEARLRQRVEQARVPVTFVISPSDALLYALYQSAGVFIFPPVEDFGIMPVEAMAAGCAVVTTPVGGARESVTDGVSGVVAESDAVSDVAAATERALALPRRDIPATVARFSESRFRAEIREWVETETADA